MDCCSRRVHRAVYKRLHSRLRECVREVKMRRIHRRRDSPAPECRLPAYARAIVIFHFIYYTHLTLCCRSKILVRDHHALRRARCTRRVHNKCDCLVSFVLVRNYVTYADERINMMSFCNTHGFVRRVPIHPPMATTRTRYRRRDSLAVAYTPARSAPCR